MLITITLKVEDYFARLNDDALFDLYTDLGAMGDNMDCEDEYWNALCAEVDKRNQQLFNA